MTTTEAIETISKDFMNRYLTWIEDHNSSDMTDYEYGRKYGWGKGQQPIKDNQKSLIWFQGHIYSGRYLNGWSEIGIDRNTIYQLHKEGFLSYDYYSSYKARMTGKTDFYYLNQIKVKEIYKLYKSTKAV